MGAGHKRGRRNWENKEEAQKAVYANRRRIRGERGKRLMRRRGEKVERTFAHCYETGAMRRTHLRGHENILKRLLCHLCGFNLSLILRKLVGCGAPKELADRLNSLIFVVFSVIRVWNAWCWKSKYKTGDRVPMCLDECMLRSAC